MKQYHELLETILAKGSYKEPAREGMPGTTSLFGYQSRYDLQKGFPILTTKQVNFKHIVVELLWFLRGDTNIKYLVDNGCNIWNQDAFNYYEKLRDKHVNEKSVKVKFTDFIQIVKEKGGQPHSHIPNYNWGDCGFQYGRVWRKWENIVEDQLGLPQYQHSIIDQLAKVIQNIRTKPYDRRKLITAVDPAHDEDLALYWCHSLFQFNCRRIEDDVRAHWAVDNLKMHRNEFMFPDDIQGRTLEEQLDDNEIPKYYLDCHMYQRSADVFLGVPYNISSYALLTHITAKMCNMLPGEFIHSFGDVHIYDNHMEQVKEILTRDPERYKLPTLKFFRSELDWSNVKPEEIAIADIHLEGYESYPPIKAELSTGMKQDRP